MLRRGSLALFFGGCAIALSACGGGSGTSGPPPALPATTVTPSTPPTPGPDIPLGAGQSFSYNGTMTATQLRLLPAPMPTATTLTTVQQNGVLKDGQTFNGVNRLYDVSVAESDSTALKTSTSQTDTYYALSSPAPDGTTSLLEYGSTWADENQNTLTYLYSTPQILGELPEKVGTSWTNTPAMTVYENDANDANGSAIFSKTVYAQDGSYTETTTYPPGYNAGQSIITENADGSGSISNVFGIGVIIFAPPQPQSLGTYLLPYAVYGSPNPGPTAQPLQSTTVGAWYTVPVTLYHEADADLGSQPLPAACNVPSSVATAAMDTRRTITRTDTILGYTDAQTIDEYRVRTAGAVCVQMNDTQNSYYDFNGDQLFIIAPSSSPTYVPTPYQTNTTSETLGLSNGASPSSKRRTATAATITPLSTAAIAAARMQFQARVAQLRTQRKVAFVKAFKAFITKHHGGVR